MRFALLALGIAGAAAAWQAAVVNHPLVQKHIDTMKAAPSISIKLTDSEIGGATDEQTLVLSKPNMLRFESSTELIIANGTTVWKYNKTANSYEESTQKESFEGLLKKEVPWMWSAFFNPDFAKTLQTAVTGNKRKIKGTEATEVNVTLPNNKMFTFFFDEKLNAFRGGTYQVGGGRAPINHMVIGAVEIGTEAAKASEFEFAIPNGATKVDPSAPVHTNLTYKDIATIFSQNCTPCHAGGSPKAGVDVTSYYGLVEGNRPIVVPGKADSSKAVMITRSGKMPPGRRLPSAEIDKIAEWINGGAKED